MVQYSYMYLGVLVVFEKEFGDSSVGTGGKKPELPIIHYAEQFRCASCIGPNGILRLRLSVEDFVPTMVCRTCHVINNSQSRLSWTPLLVYSYSVQLLCQAPLSHF